MKHHRLVKFLHFAAGQAPDGSILNTLLLTKYHTIQYKKYAPRTAYDNYNEIRSATIFLINRGTLAKFPVPKNRSKVQVNNSAARSGQTLATTFRLGEYYKNVNATNEVLIKTLGDILWTEIERLPADFKVSDPPINIQTFTACAFGLLAMACVNATSIIELQLDDLRADDRDSALRRLTFRKPRAGGDVALPPFPVGGTKARSLPRLWERIIRMTREIRDIAPDAIRHKLMLRLTKRGEVAIFENNSFYEIIQQLRKVLSVSYTHRTKPESINAVNPERKERRNAPSPGHESHDVIRANAHLVTLALIRVSAINIANVRLRRHASLTKEAIGHRLGNAALEGNYLSNPQYKADLDTELRDGQSALEEWVRRPFSVLSPNEAIISSELGVDSPTAQRILAEEFNLGMGASLANNRMVVIDTPLNALRMTQWIEKLVTAELPMLNENPERWKSVYEPQLILFQQAVLDFSYQSKQEALRLWKDEGIELPFPEVI